MEFVSSFGTGFVSSFGPVSLLRFRPASLFFILVCCWFSALVVADLADDTSGLTSLQLALDRNKQLNWSSSVNVCNWEGVQCDSNINRVTSLRLPGQALVGSIPVGSIGRLTQLRVVSLRSNRITGSLPADLANCTFMRSIYLQNNQLSGSLPSDFTLWPNLVHLDLSGNNFNGSVPSTLANLTQLKSLFLQNNSLTGPLPAIDLSSLTNFSVAFNQLNGSIPDTETYRKFNQSAFIGNDLCGFPLPSCSGVAPTPGPASNLAPTHHKRKLSGGAIAGIVIACVVVLLFLGLLCFLVCRKARSKEPKSNPYATTRSIENVGVIEPDLASAVQSKGEATTAAAGTSDATKNQLVFFAGDKYSFDLEDLLRASAEVLGKGSVGTAYKAVLESGAIVAVKRLKDVTIERKAFEEQLTSAGNLTHEHLVPLVAYYYSREEKLLVYEYMTNGSLSALLHGNKLAHRTPLDWDTRVKIALGAALAIDYLHDQGSTHGNIKSSNILLTNNYNSCISDYGLVQLVSATPAAHRIIGYRAPEVTDIRKTTQKADVYSYGVLLLELLTGKAPSPTPTNDEDGIDLPRWVNSVVREEWTAEVFDPELMRYQEVQEDMLQLLQMALLCASTSPDQRPTMKQVVKLVEDLKKNDGVEE